MVSSGSDSSVDENNMIVQFPGGTVIHSGPSFIPNAMATPIKDQGENTAIFVYSIAEHTYCMKY